MSFWGCIILGAVVGFIWNLKDWSKLKRIVCIVVAFIVCAFIFGESGTESNLKKWALESGYLDYDDVSIKKVEKLSEDADFDYKIYADIEQGDIECTVYLFVKLNSSETKVLRTIKDDSELSDAVINDAKKRNPGWDW